MLKTILTLSLIIGFNGAVLAKAKVKADVKDKEITQPAEVTAPTEPKVETPVVVPTATEIIDKKSPVGFWKTIDDETKEPKAIVEITERNKKYYGTIIKRFPKPGDSDNCTKCSGAKKNKPIIGLEILWDLKKDGDEYDDGEILDPKNGTTYDAKIKVLENGEKLKVRGFIGLSLLGRTQYWLRSTANGDGPLTNEAK